ncbi:NAD(P)-dependent oxidoreductase [Spirulina sp. CS-785/01]|uniref:NAD-dependent epimerase/dehydratase family protein n=1 Tax=Spirulina sp. CS-785/01 TaxID=3021716 RepID=UPI00232ADC01|nr:NAD(P)-dependent oxidoreductase [Spirulina sp. CS-785/01]MDB9311688.1 NAD(P)-dependent oxidoreductase [Spirulina sp. CS-785/01]
MNYDSKAENRQEINQEVSDLAQAEPKTKKILITGGLGYVGGRLAAYLRQFPHYKLRLLVRRIPTELQDWVEGLEIWQGDLTQPETLQGVGDNIDGVVHLAALDAPTCTTHPTEALRVNVEGTLNLLEALQGEIEHFLYYSTFHVYGRNAQGRVTEDTPLAPIHPYAATHAMAELYAGMYARRQGFGASIIRSANSFGAPLYTGANCWTIVFNDLCYQAVTQQRLQLKSAGLQVRNFIPLPESLRVVELLLRTNLQSVEVYNLGGEQSYSILEAAELVQKVYFEDFGQMLPIERPEPQKGEQRGVLDYRCDRLKALGFQQQMSLSENIRQTLQFCQEHFIADQI